MEEPAGERAPADDQCTLVKWGLKQSHETTWAEAPGYKY